MFNINFSYTNISDFGMRNVAHNCPNLKIVKLQGMRNISNVTLSMLAKHCNKIFELDVQDCPGISDYGVKLISQECKGMENLNLSGCVNITDEIVPYLAYYSKGLKQLNLRDTKITSKGVLQLVNSLPLLEVLKIPNIRVSDEDLAPILVNRKIRILDLSFCYGVSISMIEKLIEFCPITEIHLFGCISSEDKNRISSVRNREVSIFC